MKLSTTVAAAVAAATTSAIVGAIAYVWGRNEGEKSAVSKLQQESGWKELLTEEEAGKTLSSGLQQEYAWNGVSEEIARNTLPLHLNQSKIPHGDLVVDGDNHAKRYLISQWQRGAAGAIVALYTTDKDGDFCIALGPQREKMRIPQGYSELPVPKTDLTSSKLCKYGASRLNGNTGEYVLADEDIVACAAREVKEETGLDIDPEDLVLMGVQSGKYANPVVPTTALEYACFIPDAPKMKVLDNEFPEDDMQEGIAWVKVKNIEQRKEQCFIKGNPLPLEEKEIQLLQRTITSFATDKQKAQCEGFLEYMPKISFRSKVLLSKAPQELEL